MKVVPTLATEKGVVDSKRLSTDSATRIECDKTYRDNNSNNARPSNSTDLSYDDGMGDASTAANSSGGMDVAFDLMVGRNDEPPISEQEANRIRRKLDWHLLPLLFLLHGVQFMEKISLSYCAVLGLLEDNNLSVRHFNDLGSAYYIGFILFQWPHSWAFQHLPVAKYLGANVILWSLLSGLHLLTPQYGGLFVLRLILGASEGCVTPGVMVLIAMFYDRAEISQRIGWTIQCNGLAQVVASLISFGVYQIAPTAPLNSWRSFMLIISGLCLITGSLILRYFPNNPTTASFLGPEDRMLAIRRIQSNQSGIEAKKWKKAQFIEALTDPKTWLFSLFGACATLQSGIALQMSLLIKGFNFTVSETTLLNIPPGFTSVLAVLSAGFVMHWYPNSRSWVSMIYTILPIVGCSLLIALPLGDRAGRLVSFYLVTLSLPVFTSVVGWVIVTTSGHTKKLTVNAIFQTGYSLGMIIGPQFWQAKYRPRNALPYSLIIGSFVGDIIIILVLRLYLQRENRRRELLNQDSEDHAYIDRKQEDGTIERIKVSKTLLDLTDRENKAFRYAL